MSCKTNDNASCSCFTSFKDASYWEATSSALLSGWIFSYAKEGLLLVTATSRCVQLPAEPFLSRPASSVEQTPILAAVSGTFSLSCTVLDSVDLQPLLYLLTWYGVTVPLQVLCFYPVSLPRAHCDSSSTIERHFLEACDRPCEQSVLKRWIIAFFRFAHISFSDELLLPYSLKSILTFRTGRPHLFRPTVRFICCGYLA